MKELERLKGKATRHFVYAAMAAAALLPSHILKDDVDNEARPARAEQQQKAAPSAAVQIPKSARQYYTQDMLEMIDFENNVRTMTEEERDGMLAQYAKNPDDLPYFDAVLRAGTSEKARLQFLSEIAEPIPADNLGAVLGTFPSGYLNMDNEYIFTASGTGSRTLGDRLIQAAVVHDDLERIRALVTERGVDPMALGGRALTKAAEECDWKTVDLLLAHGATFENVVLQVQDDIKYIALLKEAYGAYLDKGALQERTEAAGFNK